jgi:hypothetical protein
MGAIMFIYWLSSASLVGGSVTMETRDFSTVARCETARAKLLAAGVYTDPKSLIIVCVER